MAGSCFIPAGGSGTRFLNDVVEKKIVLENRRVLVSFLIVVVPIEEHWTNGLIYKMEFAFDVAICHISNIFRSI